MGIFQELSLCRWLSLDQVLVTCYYYSGSNQKNSTITTNMPPLSWNRLVQLRGVNMEIAELEEFKQVFEKMNKSGIWKLLGQRR